MQQPIGVPPPGFRLPNETRVGAVRLQVSDLERSLRFYENVLGFRVLTRTADGASLGVDEGRPLVVLDAAPGTTPSQGGALGLYHFAVLLPDRAALGRLALHFEALHVGAGVADHLVSEAVYLSDPDGLGIELYADRPRSSWRSEDRQLMMTTEPLDLVNLVAAAGQHLWQGLPAGTVIGHLHLHVGDLRAAENFYHRALGFDKVVWSYQGALFFSAGGYHHHLGVNTWGSGERAADHAARLLQWELVLPGEEAAAGAAGSLLQAGHHVVEEADGAWQAEDPWGTRLRLTPA